MIKPAKSRRFQVALSFPGEYRSRVENIAKGLADILGREKILYDKWYRAEFARPNLDDYLPRLYHEKSQLLVFFLCREYSKKEWCGLEWRAGRDLLKRGEDDRLMFLRLDGADIPGLYSIDGYLDIAKMADGEVVQEILQRLRIISQEEAADVPHSKVIFEAPDPQNANFENDIQRLLKGQIFSHNDASLTQLLQTPGGFLQFVRQLLRSDKRELPTVLGDFLSYCLSDHSNNLYQQYKRALADLGAQFQHGSQSPVVRLHGTEEIPLLLPMTAQIRYMEVRGQEITGIGRAKLLGLAPKQIEMPDIHRVLHYLELNLQDDKLEAGGYHLEFYWDSADVVEAVLGMAAYYNSEFRFEIDQFRSDAALVHCLLGAGWLGPIQMLQPHQAEFLRLFEYEFGIGSVTFPPGGAWQFIRDAGLRRARGRDLNTISSLSATELGEIVRQEAGNAPTLFKVIQCIAGTWEMRLSSWIKTGLLKTSDSIFDYGSLASSEVFGKIKNAFDAQRPKTTVNNFNDAMTICMLAEKVRDYAEGRSRGIPYFFASHNLYRQVLEATHLQNLLEYRHEDRVRSVLHDEGYYLLRAALHPQQNRLATPHIANFSHFVQEVQEHLRTIVTHQEDFVRVANPTAAEAVRSLQLFWFLENIWLPYAAQTDLSAALKKYVETALRLDSSPEFKKALKSEINKIAETLEEQTQEYKQISRFWMSLEEAAHTFHQRLGDAYHNLFNTLGLLRFGFPEPDRAGIEALLLDLVNSDLTNHSALLNICHKWQVVQRSAGTASDFIVLGAILWSLHLDDFLIELLSRVDPKQHYSLRVLMAASCFRAHKKVDSGWSIIQSLEKEHQKSTDTQFQFDLSLALSYLLFHYLRMVNVEPQQRGDLINKAIMYAKTAVLLETGAAKRIEALNQYLCCMSQAEDRTYDADIRNAANQMLSFMSDAGIWQYRYDDTLASYFERAAALSKTSTEKRMSLEAAMRHLERAWRSAYGDEEVRLHLIRVQNKL